LQNLIWYALTLGGLVGCLTFSAQLAQRLSTVNWTPDERYWLYAIGTLVSLKFVFAAIASQNYDVIVVLLILVGLVLLAEDRRISSVWAGIAFGCAAALKATPLLFLPYLLFKRHYSAAGAMTVAVVVASTLPDLAFTYGRRASEGSYLLAWLHQVATPALMGEIHDSPRTFWGAMNSNNNSLRGLVGMFIPDYVSSFKTTLYTVYAVYVLIVGFLIKRSYYSRPSLTIDGALLLISMLMLSPMSSESHYVALMLAVFSVTAIWLKGDAVLGQFVGYFLIVSFLLINAAARDIVGMTITTWAKDHRLLVIDVLLFLVPFAWFVFKSQPTTRFRTELKPVPLYERP
jgi:hypothetical protein